MALTKLTSVDKSVAKKLLSELSIQVSTVAEMKTKSYEVGQVVETKGYYAEGDAGAAKYLVKAAQAFDGYGDHELVNGTVAVLQHINGTISALSYGISNDRSKTTDSDAVQEIFNSVNGSTSFIDKIDFTGCKLELSSAPTATFIRPIEITGGEFNGNYLFIDGCVAGCKVTGGTYQRDTLVNGTTTGTIGLLLRNTRELTIENNHFKNIDRAIESNQTSTGFHTLGQIKIINNNFNPVNYAVYLDHDRASSFVISDLTFSSNVIGESYISALFAYSLDGLLMNGNTVFSSQQGASKAENVRVAALSDQIIITNNNLFTAGKEGIRLTNPKSVVIVGNNIVWSGTRLISSGVKIDGTQSATNIHIHSNLIQGATKSSIELDIPDPLQSIGRNELVGDGNPIYYGVPDYLLNPRYAVEDLSTGTHKRAVNDCYDYEFDYLYKGFKFSIDNNGGFASKTIDVSTANVPIFEFKGDDGSTADYSAKIKVLAEKGTAQKATYYLTINQSGIGNEIVQDGAFGLATGGSGWPSVSFTHVGNELLATPVVSGGGVIDFTCSVQGDTNAILQAL